jgi:hypothetical protein
LWIFGGKTKKIINNDVWVYDTAKQEWREYKTPYGAIPFERIHANSWVDHRGRVIVQGGEGASRAGPLDDMWYWELGSRNNNIWTEIGWTKENGPGSRMPPRVGGTGAFMEGLYFFGGFKEGVYMNDLWYWDPIRNTFRLMPSADGVYPPGRMFHFSIFRSMLLVYGGYGPPQTDDPEEKPKPEQMYDMWGYDIVRYKWKPIKASGSKPPPLYGTRSFRHGDEVCLCGGMDGMDEHTSAIFCFDASWEDWRQEFSPSGTKGSE